MKRQEIIKTLEEILPEVSKPTRYLGNELNAVHKDFDKQNLTFALAFPDRYEVGMSHLGIKILYHLLNQQEGVVAERVYAPWLDLEKKMRELQLPLFSLESKTPVAEFDIIGFTLQYEMSYTNIINMLDLAGLPLESANRNSDDPLVIAGGPCTVNPEPIVDFFDVVVIGEAEDLAEDLVAEYLAHQKSGGDRKELLRSLAKLPGVYVPSFYEADYQAGSFKDIRAQDDNCSAKITKRVVEDLNAAYYPTQMIVPYMEIVHDRIPLEIARGCTRGCRFCQAGMIYRPVRERSQARLEQLAERSIKETGYEELSLVSLSSSDYSQIELLVEQLVSDCADLKVGISLPSLRTDTFSLNLADQVQQVRKSSLTFAPEAGTQRLRDVINKGVTEEDLLTTAQAAYDSGWQRIKLYFMIGLPTETEADLAGMVDLAKKVAAIGKWKVKVSTSIFVPKPHTPFQWSSFVGLAEIEEKLSYLKKNLRGKGLSYDWHEPDLSLLEAAFARGDRRLNQVLKRAWQLGAKFDSWLEHFNFDLWKQAFEESGLDLADYVYRDFDLEAKLPWEHLEVGVSRDYLLAEYRRALAEETTDDCRFAECNGCGVLTNIDIESCLVGDSNED
ncbi:TIGR03960 family B12-binding radical SAM protein [Fuchsiella alkaliacetigena]|uniref:TIGR03960 family B12-binding radical SAM protein n=1 Tax=Fuchsiella alkaliacetigena TaxID=957042 RepID=UPI00200AC3F2|nr:TIGR03960 family B12-binding radical SAM protein [Fuchsiella alkaliacetigena]MCK8825608.1 TIGR03960 family B12-binding radical SAM protein [Fuchsiella alkaliacetigena]